MLSNRNLWGALAGFGVASILSGIGILAATDTEHAWGWALVVLGSIAAVGGGGLYLVSGPQPQPAKPVAKARADSGSVSVVGDKNVTINMPQLGNIKAAADQLTAVVAPAPVGKLTIECRTERGIRLGDERAALMYLVVIYWGCGKAGNVDAMDAEIYENTLMSLNSVTRPYRHRRYEHQDIFLKWEASETRYHDFHTTARLRVARGRAGNGQYGLANVEPPGGLRLSLFDIYEITVEIAADNAPVLREKLFVRMAENTTRDGNRVTIWPGPYKVDFRRWADSDQPEGEQDLDAMRREAERST